jgi:hypothetical protein
LLNDPPRDKQGWEILVKTILGMARLAVLAGALALTGCVTVENTLSANDIAAMKLTGVTVSYAPDALIRWDDGIQAYAASKGIVDPATATAYTPEAKAYMRTLLAPRIKAGVEQAMAGELNGTRPVRLDLVVRSFTIVPVVQRIVIGGSHDMTADANLVDARTGAIIIANPKLAGMMGGGDGLIGAAVQGAITNGGQTTVDRLANIYGKTYRNWLLRRAFG